MASSCHATGFQSAFDYVAGGGFETRQFAKYWCSFHAASRDLGVY
jgi:hypothetical protein